jgi:serine/threonine protein kinase
MDKSADTNQSTRSNRKDKNKDNPNEPSVIGNYKIDRTLGQGTYGKVKLGLHIVSSQKVDIF